MRRITLWLLSTLTVLVLLFSYRTSTSSAMTTTTASGLPGSSGGSGSGSAGTSGDATSSDTSATGSTGSGSSTGSTGSGSSTGSTYTGDAVATRYGPVQVQITVVGGKVTKSVVTQVPWNDHKDQEINSYAVPILNQEAVAAQSSSIDMVSGATFTSDGYIQSLQSALDQANL